MREGWIEREPGVWVGPKFEVKPKGLRQRLGALLVVLVIVRMIALQVDADVPGGVKSSKRITRLYRMADEFAAAGRDDPAAVAELHRAAGRRRKNLRHAAASARMNGRAKEFPRKYLTNQLLLAAATGRPVAPITAELADWFRQVRELNEDWDSSFARLVAMRPLLAEVQRILDSETEAARAKPTEAERDAALDAVRDRARMALPVLVGAEADVEEPLLRSYTAYRIVQSHLVRYR